MPLTLTDILNFTGESLSDSDKVLLRSNFQLTQKKDLEDEIASLQEEIQNVGLLNQVLHRIHKAIVLKLVDTLQNLATSFDTTTQTHSLELGNSIDNFKGTHFKISNNNYGGRGKFPYDLVSSEIIPSLMKWEYADSGLIPNVFPTYFGNIHDWRIWKNYKGKVAVFTGTPSAGEFNATFSVGSDFSGTNIYTTNSISDKFVPIISVLGKSLTPYVKFLTGSNAGETFEVLTTDSTVDNPNFISISSTSEEGNLLGTISTGDDFLILNTRGEAVISDTEGSTYSERKVLGSISSSQIVLDSTEFEPFDSQTTDEMVSESSFVTIDGKVVLSSSNSSSNFSFSNKANFISHDSVSVILSEDIVTDSSGILTFSLFDSLNSDIMDANKTLFLKLRNDSILVFGIVKYKGDNIKGITEKSITAVLDNSSAGSEYIIDSWGMGNEIKLVYDAAMDVPSLDGSVSIVITEGSDFDNPQVLSGSEFNMEFAFSNTLILFKEDNKRVYLSVVEPDYSSSTDDGYLYVLFNDFMGSGDSVEFNDFSFGVVLNDGADSENPQEITELISFWESLSTYLYSRTNGSLEKINGLNYALSSANKDLQILSDMQEKLLNF